MMEFADVASFFDDTPTYDWYSGVYLFDAQYNTFEESSVDGAVVRKRTMSVHPSLTAPTRHALNVLGEGWLMGWGAVDGFQGEAVRKSHWLKMITDTAILLTPAEACSSAAGVSLAVNRDFLKFTVDGINTSDYFPFWEFYTSPSETPARGKFFKVGSTLYRIRGANLDDSGLLCAQCDELEPSNLVSVVIGNQVYDSITDTTSGTLINTTGIIFSMYKFYKLVTEADPLNHAGDMTLLLVEDIPVGSTVTINSKTWQILAKVPELDVFSYHLRGV